MEAIFWIISWLVVGFLSIIIVGKYQKNEISLNDMLLFTFSGFIAGVMVLGYFLIELYKNFRNVTIFNFNRENEEGYIVEEELDDDDDEDY